MNQFSCVMISSLLSVIHKNGEDIVKCSLFPHIWCVIDDVLLSNSEWTVTLNADKREKSGATTFHGSAGFLMGSSPHGTMCPERVDSYLFKYFFEQPISRETGLYLQKQLFPSRSSRSSSKWAPRKMVLLVEMISIVASASISGRYMEQPILAVCGWKEAKE